MGLGKSGNLDIVWDFVEMSLGAVAALAAVNIGTKIDAARDQGFRVMKAKTAVCWDLKTTGDGPIILGFSANQTNLGVEECLEADPQNPNTDGGGQDQFRANRACWPIAMVNVTETNGRLANGAFVDIPIKWSMPEHGNFDTFAYNNGSGAMTAGMLITFATKLFGVWLRD